MNDLKLFNTRFNLSVHIPTVTDREGSLKQRSTLEIYCELDLSSLKKKIREYLEQYDDKDPEFYISCIDPETKVLVQMTSDFYYSYENGDQRGYGACSHRVRELDRWEKEKIEDYEIYQDRERRYQSFLGDIFHEIEQELEKARKVKEEEEWKKGEAQRKRQVEYEEQKALELYQRLKQRFEK